MKDNKKIITMTLLIIGIVLIVGTSYAFFVYVRESSKNSQLIAGEVYMHFVDGTNIINLTNAFPEADIDARAKDDNYITFTIDGKNTTTNKDIYYEIILDQAEAPNGSTNKLEDSHLKFDLEETKLVDVVSVTNRVLDAVSYNEINNTSIWVNTISKNTTTEIEITYKLRMWISDQVLISDTVEGAEYTTGEYTNSYAIVKVIVKGDFEEKVADEPIPTTAAETIVENIVAYSVSSTDTFTGGLVGINTSGTLYNETDTSQAIREYRYSGPSVNNYVYFNCADTAGGYNYGDENYPYNETNCELWRIVGIFKNEQGEWNIKLMRNTVLQTSELVETYTYNGLSHYIQYNDDSLGGWVSNKLYEVPSMFLGAKVQRVANDYTTALYW